MTMALKTTKWDLADSFREPQDIYRHLNVEFENYEPKGMPYVLDAVLRARGGATVVAAETGIPESSFRNLETLDEAAVRNLAVTIMEAYRPASASAKVA
jgi:DNA-binding phage protein